MGRADIAFTVSTMARFSAMPKEGHMLAMYRLYGYLKGSVKAKIVYDPRIPDYSTMCEPGEPEWQGLYPGASEEVDEKRNPKPRGTEASGHSYLHSLTLTMPEMKQQGDQSRGFSSS